MNKDEIDAIAKLSSEVVKPIYNDTLKPAAQQIGKALGTVTGVVNVALAPISLFVYGFDKIEKKLKKSLGKKLENIKPKKNIKQP